MSKLRLTLLFAGMGLMLCQGTAPATAQSHSIIGKYLDMGGPDAGKETSQVLTSDGEWLVFVRQGGSCAWGGYTDRLTMIRTDGTDFRLIADMPYLQSLKATGNSGIRHIELSGSGNRLAFVWPHGYTLSCNELGFPHWFFVDIETGLAEEFLFNAMPVGGISFTDDGEAIVFGGFDPGVGKYLWHRADADGSNAVPFLDVSQWYFTQGRISGDGSAFAIIGVHGPYPFPADVYVYDFETASLTKVSQETTDQIRSLSISSDGSRVLYGSSQGPLFAVKSDASEHHLIKPDWTQPGGVGLSRDGRYVFYQDGDTFTPLIRKATWDGDVVQTIHGRAPNIFFDTGQIPVDADGSIVGFVNTTLPSPPGTFAHFGVWHEDVPVLTTYGHGVPGTPLYWDIGGQPGDAFILAYAMAGAELPFKHYGTLGLDPASLRLLAVGGIPATDTVASLELMVPAAAPIVGPLPVYFQALVFDGRGPAGKLTNTTVFTLDVQSDSLPLSIGLQAGAPPGWPPHAEARVVLPPAPETPEELLQRMMFQDAALWWRLEGSRSR